MAQIQRRKTYTAVVGGVRVGSDAPIVVQSMTNTDTADIDGTIRQCAALARAGSELVRVTVNNDAAAAAVPYIVDGLDKIGLAGAHHRRLPLQRPHPAEEVSRVRAGAGQVPHQSRQRLHRQEGRRQLPRHDRSRHRERQAGAHRRELGLARPGAADAADGRELQARRAEGRARRDHGSHGAIGAALGRAGGELRAAQGPDHPQRQSQRSAGPDRRLSRAGAPLRVSAAPRADRSGHGLEGHRQQHRRAGRAVAGRHRRHHSRLADARAEWRPHRRGAGRAADSAVHADSQLHPAGHRLPRLRPHHLTFFQEMAEQIQGYLREQMPVWKTTLLRAWKR